MTNKTCFIVAYWGRYKDVLFTASNDSGDDDSGDDHNRLFHAMEKYLTCGHVVEILEVVWSEDEHDPHLPDLCGHWRVILRGQGYEILREWD